MTTSPVMTVTDELIADIEKEARLCDSDTSMFMDPGLIAALLAERAELKLDAERYREFRKVLIASGWTEQQADEYVDRSIA